MMRYEKSVTMFFALLFSAVLIFAFNHLYQSIQYEARVLAVEKSVSHLRLHNKSIDGMVLNEYKKQNYDQLQQEWKEFSGHWQTLKAVELPGLMETAPIVRIVREIDAALVDKYRYINHYQSAKAILANSLFYLNDIQAHLHAYVARDAQELTTHLARLLVSLFYGDAKHGDIEQQIVVLQGLIDTNRDAVTLDVDLLRAHLKMVLTQRSILEDNIAKMQQEKVDEKLEQLSEVLMTIIGQERAYRNAISLAIGSIALVMLVGLIIVLYKILYDRQKMMLLQRDRERHMKLLEEYKRALDESSIVSKTDLNGVINYVNKQFCEISGYKKEELVGKSHNIVRHEGMPSSTFKTLWETIKAQKVFHGIIENRRKDGDSYFVDVTIVPIINEQGETTEYIAIRNDITELIEAREQAVMAQQAKSAFLANMSHELRTPLNAIIGFSQILMARPDTPEPVKTYVEKMQLSGQHLLELVNTILDFSKIEAGKMDFDPKQLDVGALMDEIARMIEPQIAKKALRLHIDVPEQLTMFADRQLVKQLILNLLSNAIKFSPDEAAVHLDVAQENASQVRISICDEGPGIDAELVETIFDPFTQVKEHQTKAIKGTGLGLAISKKIVDLHGGKIWIESEVDQGSCFIVTIPELRTHLL